MKKFYKFLKSFLFISLWLILSSFLTQYWNTFHWEYIYLNFRIIIDNKTTPTDRQRLQAEATCI